MVTCPVNSTVFTDNIGKPFGADEDIMRTFLWKYAAYTEGTKTKLDVNYPQFSPEGVELKDPKSAELFLRISQPTSRKGAPIFPRFQEVISWIQTIRKEIDDSMQAKPS
eukprot:8288630-Heterocapsa_arctica.AAC.1